MSYPIPTIVPAIPHSRVRLFRKLLLPASAVVLAASLAAQTPPPAPADSADTPKDANETPRVRRGNFNPADFQARMMTNLRAELAVTDDAEWTLISERITRVFELRRSIGGFGGFGGRNNRPAGGATTDPAQDALKSALADNLPDAEIKARLARLREMRKQNEVKLDQAREELRAVLSVRQEAVAVMAGLLN